MQITMALQMLERIETFVPMPKYQGRARNAADLWRSALTLCIRTAHLDEESLGRHAWTLEAINNCRRVLDAMERRIPKEAAKRFYKKQAIAKPDAPPIATVAESTTQH